MTNEIQAKHFVEYINMYYYVYRFKHTHCCNSLMYRADVKEHCSQVVKVSQRIVCSIMTMIPYMVPVLVGSRLKSDLCYASCENLFHNLAKINMFILK